MKIQIDIPTEINKELKIYKAKRNLKNLQETIIEILGRQFEIFNVKNEVNK